MILCTLRLLLPLLPVVVHTSPLLSRNANAAPVEMTVDSWNAYGVDEWLTTYMHNSGLAKQHFWQEFPKHVGSETDCSLDSPCRHVPLVNKDSSSDAIKTALVLASLSHFNDLFRMFNKMYTHDDYGIGIDHRSNFANMFQNAVYKFEPEVLNTTIPADVFAHILFTPIWFIPDAMPNQALRDTVEAAIKECTANGFGYTWDQYADTPSHGDQVSNIQQTIQSAYLAWIHQYDRIISGEGPISVLDFIRGGAMLKLQYAEQLKDMHWHAQAYEMYKRQIMSMVFEASGLIVHRASYDRMQPSDSGMGLEGLHDDSYDHVTYAFVSWGKDEDGNLTRQYIPVANTTTMSNPAGRVVLGQSWDCFRSTNDESYARNYKKAWELPGFDKSLFISDWDGTADGFDIHNPKCTFNIPVNDQPADIKTSWFMTQLRSTCPGLVDIDEKDWMGKPSFEVYRAFMIASDAWVSTAVAINQYVNPDSATQMSDFCKASSASVKKFEADLTKEMWSSFKMNLIMGSLFEIKDIGMALKGAYNAAGSFIKGAWSKSFREGLPVIEHPAVAPKPYQIGDHANDHGDAKVENKPDGGDVASDPKPGKNKGDQVEKPKYDDYSDGVQPGKDDSSEDGQGASGGKKDKGSTDVKAGKGRVDDAIANLDQQGEDLLKSLGAIG